MTTVRDIIKGAYRETNLIPLGVDPTAEQLTEGFSLLSTVVAGVLGNEAGENMVPFPLGTNEIVSPGGYPWWQNNTPGNIFINTNVRVMCNLTGPGTINLHPKPHDGARFGIVDVSQNFDLYPLTVVGNGRSIEGQDQMTYSVPGLIREWVYREDLGNWVTVLPLSLDGQMPYPPEFDDMFIIKLALRLNPRNGQVAHPASVQGLREAQLKFSARYKQSGTQMPSEDGLVYLTHYYRVYGRPYGSLRGNSDQVFNSGYPY